MELDKQLVFQLKSNKQISINKINTSTLKNEKLKMNEAGTNSINIIAIKNDVKEITKGKGNVIPQNEVKKNKDKMLLIKTYSKSNRSTGEGLSQSNVAKEEQLVIKCDDTRKQTNLKETQQSIRSNVKTTPNIIRNCKGVIHVKKTDDNGNVLLEIQKNDATTDFLSEKSSKYDCNNNVALEQIDGNKNVSDRELVQFRHETNQEDNAENLLSDINPQEWLDLDQFEKIVKDLNSTNSSELCDIEESIEKYTINKTSNAVENKETNESTIKNGNEDIKSNDDEVKNEVISISSEDDTDLKLSLSLDELDTVSMTSIEAICANIDEITTTANNITVEDGNYDDKIEIEINTHVQYTHTSNKENDDLLLKITDVKSQVNEEITDTKNTEIDTISLLSNDSKGVLDDYCSGYNSSDFEFITEDEAKSQGFIINYYKKKDKKTPVKNTCKTIEVTVESENDSNLKSIVSFSSAAGMPGSSRQSQRNYYQRPPLVLDYKYRDNHAIPQGPQYVNLFEGYNYAAPYMFENKTMGSYRGDMPYEGIGFDMRAVKPEDSDDENKNDAEETAKMILHMYPAQNRKRRRRF